MKYVALLRGINVGGKNKVDMRQLKDAMLATGYKEVSTYINSGNIFFDSDEPAAKSTEKLERLLLETFGFAVKVLLRDHANISKLVAAIPVEWSNGADMKCDVMFLWEAYDNPTVIEQLTIKDSIDEVRYAHGAIIWKVDRENITKSGMMKLIGTDLYAHMTIRNCNTVRKIKERMDGTA